MPYKSDTPISKPVDTGRFTARRTMGGFGWHPNHGMFIPVKDVADNIEKPYPDGMTPYKIPNV